MPLLRRQPFYRQKPPPDLRLDEEVFHCKLTNEIFRDYEEFFERIILCNSLVWSCSITGRAGLTYQEALECEERALKNLATFPGYLQKPVLFLATLTHRCRLVDMNDDVFVFAKDRFFIGEVVEVSMGGERKSCKILRVIPPAAANEASDCIVIDESDEDEESVPKSKGGMILPSEKYRYVVQERGKTNITITVPAKQISRKKGLYTRDKSKLFLKQYCEPDGGVWKVKNDVIVKKGLEKTCFQDYFSGPVPSFEVSESKRKFAAGKKAEATEIASSSQADLSKKKKKVEKSKKEKERPVKKMEEVVEEEPKLSAEAKAALKEQERQQKMAEKLAKKEELRKRLDEERQKRKEEKAKEREKMMEERRIQAEYLREWSRMRDDMECDDLKVMPEFVPIKSMIPTESFGDAVMVIEFVNCFKALFDLREYFPKGFTYEILEKALFDTDHNGLLTDILLMMMTSIFRLQEEEEEEEKELSEQEDGCQTITSINDVTDFTSNQLIDSASMFSQIPQLGHGTLLKKLPLDSFTLSEILRLHLLSSGARGKDKNIKYRFQQRGGYTSQDDPGLDFRRQEPAILKNLSIESVFDLPPSDKLKLLKVLIHQFLTYAATRDDIEDNFERLKQLRMDLKQMQWSEHRREREEAAARYKQKMEERQREREKFEAQRIRKLQLIEERMKAQEMGLPLPPLEEDKVEDDGDIKTEEEKEEIRQMEEEEEANKKADFALRERDMFNSISRLQHAFQIFPLGRDRLYRRYWKFQSISGLFIEDNEEYIFPDMLQPIPQNPDSNPFKDGSQPIKMLPPLPAQPQKPPEENNGSDKENESMNSSMNISADSASLNNTQGAMENSLNTSVKNDNNTLKNSVNGTGEDVVCISDEDDDDEDDSPPVLEKEEEMEVDEKFEPVLDSLVAKQIFQKTKCQWTYVSNIDQLEELLKSLNPRGFREGALKQVLIEQKNSLVETIEKCPSKCLSFMAEELNGIDQSDSSERSSTPTSQLTRVKKTNKGLIKGDLAQEVLEINLRELLLDLEERIFVGSLGALKINDRSAWRKALEHGSYDPQTEDPTYVKSDSKKVKEDAATENGDDATSVSSDDSAESTVKDLAKALSQLQRAVEPKYLQPPLGEAVDSKQKTGKQKASENKKEEKKKKKDKDEDEDSDGEEESSKPSQRSLLEHWENFLMYSTSLSQVFLHLATLEKSIAWSKSALHARCRICRRKGDAEKMLLCDKCDRGHHMYCLKPALKTVPSGDWFCPDCKPKEKRSPLKSRRRTFSEQSEDEVDEDEEEEEEDDSNEEEEAEDSEEEEEEDSENDNLCAVCNKTGMLICCDTCPLSYHLACAKPVLKKVPRGKWLCQLCSGVEKQGKIKLPTKAGHKKTKAKSTPSSSKASSRKGSPRDSPVTVKVGKKRRADSPAIDDKPKMKKGGRSASKLPELNGDEQKQSGSSSRGNSKVQHMKICEDVVSELTKHEDAWPFLKPVSKKLVPDYYDIIENPMDFSTIRNKINKFEYTFANELVSDVRQIFRNCAEYNKKTTTEYKCGLQLSKLFEKKMKEYNISVDDNGVPPNKKSRRTL